MSQLARAEQVLHAVRIAVPGVLGDAPAVLPRQVGQQPEHEPADPAAGLHPGNRPAIRASSLSVSASPPVGFYAVAHGHRLII